MTYVPTVTVNNGEALSSEIELIAATLKVTPGYTTWDLIFPNPQGISQGAVDWINAAENPKNDPELAGEDTAGPSTSADPQTTIDPVLAMSEESTLPYGAQTSGQ